MTLKVTALKFDMPNQLVGTVTFQPDNGIMYGQDFAYYKGVPDGVTFDVFDVGNGWRLVAPGYGDLSGGAYGNGALYISKESMPLEPKGVI